MLTDLDEVNGALTMAAASDGDDPPAELWEADKDHKPREDAKRNRIAHRHNGRPSEILDRTPPHDLDAERAVLGSLLAEPSLLPTVGRMLRPADFHNADHRRLYGHILALSANGGTVDVVGLQSAMGSNGRLADEDAAMVAELFSGHWNLTAIEHHAATVKRHAEARRLIHAATDILQITYNGAAPAVVRERLRAVLEEIDSGKPAAPRFPLVSCKALDSEDFAASPIITEALFAGSPAVIGGMFKTGKTLLGIDATISIATGRMFLGAYTVPEPRGVVYFTGEGGPSVAQEYGRRIAASKGIELADVTGLHWCFSVPRLEDLRDLDAFAKVLEDTGAEVAILDNLMLCLSGDNAGNVYSMGGILGNAVRICSERNVTPIFIHHFKRTRATADPYAPGELIDLTQAGVAEIAGQWLLLARREAYRPDEAGEHKLWLTVGGRMGHSSLAALDIHEGRRTDPGGRRWEVEVLRADEARQAAAGAADQAKAQARRAKTEADLEADRREIVGAAVKLKAPESKTVLRERVSCGHARFGRAFASLVADGTLQQATVTKTNGQTYDGWKVRDEQET